ncbi:MAG: hypothetical protein LQ351_007191 [Letrouitia transgressa]|nr:MAG: hypothetical protein LQ351_007191 [Letrouitia transgressa]
MRVAVAGSSGLACQKPKPQLTARGWQVVIVNYNNPQDLAFKLTGVHTVISTVSGPPQRVLIDAAAQAGVRRFAPSEFEGSPSQRPQGADALDRGKQAALERLRHHQSRGMQYTSFVCGILYERFRPEGLIGSGIGRGSGVGAEGDYLMNVRQAKAQIPRQANGQLAKIRLTSAEDVGKFVAAALGLQQWPTELRMSGEERLDVSRVVQIAEAVRRKRYPRHILLLFEFQESLSNKVLERRFERAEHNPPSLQSLLQLARARQDMQAQLRALNLIATANGRYDFASPNLNSLVNVRPKRFQAWLQEAWGN